MVWMNIVPKQKERHRCREETCGHQGGKAGGRNELGDWDSHIYAVNTVYKIGS